MLDLRAGPPARVRRSRAVQSLLPSDDEGEPLDAPAGRGADLRVRRQSVCPTAGIRPSSASTVTPPAAAAEPLSCWAPPLHSSSIAGRWRPAACRGRTFFLGPRRTRPEHERSARGAEGEHRVSGPGPVRSGKTTRRRRANCRRRRRVRKRYATDPSGQFFSMKIIRRIPTRWAGELAHRPSQRSVPDGEPPPVVRKPHRSPVSSPTRLRSHAGGSPRLNRHRIPGSIGETRT
jgi:hypothetical protein